MKILIIGKTGQLGLSIKKIIDKNSENFYSEDFIFVSKKDLNLESVSGINDFFRNNEFDIVVNCAAYTQVDKAEINPDSANNINNLAVKELAKICEREKIKLIHISTDFVFDGKNNNLYTEKNIANPINVYGQTKLDGERNILKIMPLNATIFRTSWLYSEFGNNFVKTMIKLGKKEKNLEIVCDQIGSPTYATDLAEVILKLVVNDRFKKIDFKTLVYHYSNNGQVTWSEFATEIFKITKMGCEVLPIKSENYAALAKRPKNSAMSSDLISKNLNIKTKNWKKSLNKCIKILHNTNSKSL